MKTSSNISTAQSQPGHIKILPAANFSLIQKIYRKSKDHKTPLAIIIKPDHEAFIEQTANNLNLTISNFRQPICTALCNHLAMLPNYIKDFLTLPKKYIQQDMQSFLHTNGTNNNESAIYSDLELTYKSHDGNIRSFLCNLIQYSSQNQGISRFTKRKSRPLPIYNINSSGRTMIKKLQTVTVTPGVQDSRQVSDLNLQTECALNKPVTDNKRKTSSSLQIAKDQAPQSKNIKPEQMVASVKNLSPMQGGLCHAHKHTSRTFGDHEIHQRD